MPSFKIHSAEQAGDTNLRLEGRSLCITRCCVGAEDEAQTRDPQLGRLMLYQLSYFRKNRPYQSYPFPHTASRRRRACNSNRHSFLWEVMDSNHRRRTPADLQSAPFGHSGNFPYTVPASQGSRGDSARAPKRRCPGYRVRRLGIRADGGIRTHDQLITNQLLWPTELHRQYSPFWIAKVGIKILSRKLFGIKFPLFSPFSKNPAGPPRNRR